MCTELLDLVHACAREVRIESDNAGTGWQVVIPVTSDAVAARVVEVVSHALAEEEVASLCGLVFEEDLAEQRTRLLAAGIPDDPRTPCVRGKS